MSELLRAQPLDPCSHGGNTMQSDDEIQYVSRSRPVSFYDNFKDVPVMVHCVTSAMSVGNLNQIRDTNATTTGSTINQNNNNNNNNNNNGRFSNAVSVGSISKVPSTKVTGAVSTGNIFKVDRDKEKSGLGRAPSMANCLSTTVPVNLAASQIAGRHTPTRNSLRHSRMIVLHRTGQRPQKFLPLLVYHHRLSRCLAAVQVILGIALTSLSLWLLLWAPHLPTIDNPYWSGMPLLVSGSFGICILCCFKKEYPRMGPGFCFSFIKVISVFLSVLATLACAVACIFATMHLIRLIGVECAPAHVLTVTCVCRPRTELSGNSTDTGVKYTYIDLNCPEVESIFTILLIFSASCNGFGTLIAGWYTYVHWITRKKMPQYTQVRTSPIVIDSYATKRSIYKSHPNDR